MPMTREEYEGNEGHHIREGELRGAGQFISKAEMSARIVYYREQLDPSPRVPF
jgi:hypothetical protein